MTAPAPLAADTLRRERKAAGKTMEELAGAIGCSKTLLSHMESGQRTISIPRARAIEKALKIRDGSLVAAVQWDQTPAEVRKSMTQSQQRKQAMVQDLRQAFSRRAPLRELRQIVNHAQAEEADEPIPLHAYKGIPVI